VADWLLQPAVGPVAAGYAATGLLTRTKMDPFIGADATPEYLEGLKRAIAASGIAVNMAALRSQHDIPLEETIRSLHKEIDNAALLGLKSVMTFGINNPEQFEHYFKAMADAAAYGAGKGVQVVMKPHGGSSGASGEIIAAMKKVGHPNFRLWYDAGNIIHYTGKDPIEELKPIVEYVTGFCAKDCAELKGDVMIQFGTGKVDFKGVFQVLKSAGFHGPIMVEGCAPGDTPDAVAANARANREFLEKVLAAV
jgi:sugar phosphate isomerase/epimerase